MDCGCSVGYNTSADYQLVYSTNIHQEEFLQLLEVSGGQDYLRGIEGGCPKPVMLGDSLGMVWVAENFYNSNGVPKGLIMFGPLFLSNTSPLRIQMLQCGNRRQSIHLCCKTAGSRVYKKAEACTNMADLIRLKRQLMEDFTEQDA